MSLQLLSIGQQYLSRGLLWGSLGSIRSAASYFKVKPIRVFGTRKVVQGFVDAFASRNSFLSYLYFDKGPRCTTV